MRVRRSTLVASALTLGLAVSGAVGLAAANADGTPAADPQPAPSRTMQIVGGRYESKPLGAVSLSSSTSGGGFFCTATRIGPQWVLTARHCAEVGPKRVYTNSVTATSGAYADVAAVYNAPNGDVALIKLKSAPAGDVVPYSVKPLKAGDKVTMRGWGMTSANDIGDKLKSAEGRFVKAGTNPFYKGQDLVVQGVTGVTWKGDSGGPLMKDGMVWGATSWSQSYGKDKTAQTGYGSLAPHAAWIKKTTGIAPGTGGKPAPKPSPTPPKPKPSPTAPKPVPGSIPVKIEVTEKNYSQVWTWSKSRPIVIEFGATWCGACQDLKPRLDAAAGRSGGKWSLGHVDVDASPRLTKQFKVTAYPTTVTLWQGKILSGSRKVGSMSNAEVSAYLAKMSAAAKA